MMKKKILIYWIVSLLFLSIFITPTLYAEEGDVVKSVAICHENGEANLLITMQNYGMVAIKESDVGKDMLSQLRSVAIESLKSGEKTGYFDPGSPTVDIIIKIRRIIFMPTMRMTPENLADMYMKR